MVDAAAALATDLARLRATVTELWYPSETNAPLRVVQWDPPTLAATLANPAQPLTELPGEAFFHPVLTNPFWRSPQGDHLAQRYQRLKQLLWNTLTEIKTYRSTGPEMTIYLIGRHPSGAYLGIQTVAVET